MEGADIHYLLPKYKLQIFIFKRLNIIYLRKTSKLETKVVRSPPAIGQCQKL